MPAARRAAAGLLVLLLSACSSGEGALPGISPSPVPTPTPTPTLPPLELEPVVEVPSGSWAGAVPGDPGHLYVATRSGVLRRYDGTGRQVDVVLDVRKLVSRGPERGLLGVAFDPSYRTNNRLYICYTDLDGDTRVAAYTVEAGQARRPRVLLEIAHQDAIHNGGHLAFDRTGMLLVGTGDGGNAGDPDNRAQDLRSMLGKILRIDPTNGHPAPGNPHEENRYLWAVGLRNPGRFTFGPQGELYLPDPGQNKVEELNVVVPAEQRNANYGWSVYEGRESFDSRRTFTPGLPVVWPALTYPHDDGACSIVGGEVYRGSALPWLRGSYLYGDYCRGRLLAVTRTAQGLSEPRDLGVRVQGLLGFGLDSRGELLVLSLGSVQRLVPGA